MISIISIMISIHNDDLSREDPSTRQAALQALAHCSIV